MNQPSQIGCPLCGKVNECRHFRGKEKVRIAKEIIARSLDDFWRQIESGDDILALLREFAELKLPVIRKTLSTRKKFNRQKTKARDLMDGLCIACGQLATQRHHIIQIQNGGDNRDENKVPLCFRCHAEIHPWLKQE